MSTPRFSKSSIPSASTTPRDPGFEHETNDCAVQAIAAVTGVPYRDAHAWCKRVLGREDRQGTFIDRMLTPVKQAQYVYGFRVFVRNSQSKGLRKFTSVDSYGYREIHHRPSYQTVAQFAEAHPRGRFLCSSRNHTYAVIDGVVVDNGAAGPRTQVHGFYYEFIESSKVEAQRG